VYIDVEKDFEELKAIAQKRYETLSKSEQDELKLKKKLQDFLLRKGYSYAEIKRVILYINEERDF